MGGGGSAAKTAKASVGGGANRIKKALKPYGEEQLPDLEGTGSQKQVSWAEDIRKKWVEEHIEKVQKEYKEHEAPTKRRDGESTERYKKRQDFREALNRGRLNHIEAAKETISHFDSAKNIIKARNRFNDIVEDVADAIENKSSKKEIKEIINGWLW